MRCKIGKGGGGGEWSSKILKFSKPKNFKICIYTFQCNITKGKNFEENFKDFTMNFQKISFLFLSTKKSIFKFIEFQKYKEYISIH